MNFLDVLTTSLQQDQNAFKKVVDLKKNNEIRYKKFSDITNCDQSSCPISMADFEPGEIVAQLPCNHCFNKDAITRWLSEESHKCPICRYELEYKEVRINEQKTSDENDDYSTYDISMSDIEDEIDMLESELSNVDANLDENDISNNDISYNDLTSPLFTNFINTIISNQGNSNEFIMHSLINIIDNEIQRRNQQLNQLENPLENELEDAALQQAIMESLLN